MGFGLWLFIITFAGTLLVQLWLKRTYGRYARVANASAPLSPEALATRA